MLAVGITAVGSGVGQAVLDSLHESELYRQGRISRIVGFEATPWAKAAYECDATYRVPLASDPAYRSTLLCLCEDLGLSAIIPGSDPELLHLAEMRPELSGLGCAAIVASLDALRTCRDKLVLCQRMQAVGIPFVETWPLYAAAAQKASLPYPIVVKQQRGSGSVGAQVLMGPDDWQGLHAEGEWIAQPYLIPQVWEDCLEDMMGRLSRTGLPIQQDELSVQVMVSKDGKIIGRYASLNRLKAGVPMSVDTIDDPHVWNEATRFAQALIDLGLVGPCNLQGRITRQGIRWFEANPRFTGISHVRALMGYNEVEAALRHFCLCASPDQVRRYLPVVSDRVGLRQMTEIAVARSQLDRMARRGCFAKPPPFHRVLLTGASGYLGYELLRALLDEGIAEQIVALARDPSKACLDLVDERIAWHPWEASDALPSLHDIDVIIHAAAARPLSDTDPGAWTRINIQTTCDIVRAARVNRVPYLLFISSHSVYGTQGPPLWDEETPLQPTTLYALSKAAAEAVIHTLTDSSTRWSILRLARLYGLNPRTRWGELPHRFSSLTAAGEALPVFGDGEQRIDLLHVRDAAAGITRALQSPNGWNQIHNLGSGSPTSINDLAQACALAARSIGLPSPQIVQRALDSPAFSSGMSIERARCTIGWSPQIGLEEGLRELIADAAKTLGSS